MAGSNNIPKYAFWNKENELLEFKTRGVAWSQVDGVPITTATLTSAQMLQPFFFNASTPLAVTGPTEADLLTTFFGQGYLTTVGSTAQTVIHNASNNPITVTFPGIGAVVIPANSYYTLGLTVSSAGNLSFYNPSVPAPIIGPGGFARPVAYGLSANGTVIPNYWTAAEDVLVWNGTQYVGSSNILPPMIPEFNDLSVRNRLRINTTNFPMASTTDLSLNGVFFSTQAGVWGNTTTDKFANVFGIQDLNQAANSSSKNVLCAYSLNNANAPGPYTPWRFRVHSYFLAAAIPGAGFNHNTNFNQLNELYAVDGAGNVYGQAITGTAFVTVSSREHKKDIVPVEAMSGVLEKLRPVSYRYKHEAFDAEKRLGLIVEEVAEAGLNFLLQKEEGQLDKLKVDQIPFLLLQVVKELQAEVADLRREISKN